jgi:hypothetical protein
MGKLLLKKSLFFKALIGKLSPVVADERLATA